MKEKRVLPALRPVILKDWRSRWDGHVCRVLAGPHLERSVSPGEIAVFEPTGETETVEEEYEVKAGRRVRSVEALVYRRASTRLV